MASIGDLANIDIMADDDLIPVRDVSAPSGARDKRATFAQLKTDMSGIGTLGVSGAATFSGGMRSGIISSIATNSVVSIAGTSGALLLYPNVSGGTPFGLIVARPDGVTIIMATTADTLATANSTVLTGTTGASNKVTVSWTGSVWYVENRLTYAIDYKYLLLV